MLPARERWRVLRRQVVAIAVDPVTLEEGRRRVLPAGTWVENVDDVLQVAAERRLDTVVVRTRDRAGVAGFERVAVPELCVAIV